MTNELSTFRLYVMRGAYLVITLYLGSNMWPLLFHHKQWELMHGVAVSLLAALGILTALGLRYPVNVLPILVFELFWKAIWMAAVGIPLWRAGLLDADSTETFKACGFGVVLMLLVIPWPYFWRHYVSAPGDRWTARSTQ